MVHQKEFPTSGHPSRSMGRQTQRFQLNLSLAFFLLYFLATSTQAQTASLSGTIVAKPGNTPLSEAHVFIPNTTFQTFSDGEGNFLLANLPEGTWELQIRETGWEKFSQEIQVKAGLPIRLAIRLNKASESAPIPATLSKSKRTKLTEGVYQAFVGKSLEEDQLQLNVPYWAVFLFY